MDPIPTMIKIFMPSSRVVASSWNMGAAMTEPITLRFKGTTNAMNEAIGLTYSSVVT